MAATCQVLCSSSKQEKEGRRWKSWLQHEECESFISNAVAHWPELYSNGQPLDTWGAGYLNLSTTLNIDRALKEKKEKLGLIVGGSWQGLPQLQH